jgi:hypothetical protein
VNLHNPGEICESAHPNLFIRFSSDRSIDRAHAHTPFTDPKPNKIIFEARAKPIDLHRRSQELPREKNTEFQINFPLCSNQNAMQRWAKSHIGFSLCRNQTDSQSVISFIHATTLLMNSNRTQELPREKNTKISINFPLCSN